LKLSIPSYNKNASEGFALLIRDAGLHFPEHSTPQRQRGIVANGKVETQQIGKSERMPSRRRGGDEPTTTTCSPITQNRGGTQRSGNINLPGFGRVTAYTYFAVR
jgi:hypothetical protein